PGWYSRIPYCHACRPERWAECGLSIVPAAARWCQCVGLERNRHAIIMNCLSAASPYAAGFVRFSWLLVGCRLFELAYSLILGAHLLAMNVGSAGPLVCIWLHRRARRGDEAADLAGRRIAFGAFWAFT